MRAARLGVLLALLAVAGYLLGGLRRPRGPRLRPRPHTSRRRRQSPRRPLPRPSPSPRRRWRGIDDHGDERVSNGYDGGGLVGYQHAVGLDPPGSRPDRGSRVGRDRRVAPPPRL